MAKWPKTKTKIAFTLAEVLITLGIIGVVAAMTIPTLLSNTNSQKFRSQFKKILSTLNQAVRMSQAQYDFDFSNIGYASGSNATCLVGLGKGNIDQLPEDNNICGILNASLTGHDIVTYDKIKTADGTNYSKFIAGKDIGGTTNSGFKPDINIVAKISDGSFFVFNASAPRCILAMGASVSTLSNGCFGFIDVNGAAAPNKLVSCSDSTKDGLIGTHNDCVVDNKTMGDLFPVVYHDATVEPATNAARAVLNTVK